MSNLTEQSEVIKSIDNAAHIENHVSPHCQIDGMSASEYVRTNILHQIEIARLNAIVERQKAEMVVMQVELDAAKKEIINDRMLVALANDKRHHELLEIINNPDNQYVPFYHVAYLVRAALDEVAI